jgi:dTDP-4-dehydrorhamnose 3,5-epimerase
MEIIKTKLEGVSIICPDVFNDDRGFFFEAYNKQKYDEAEINTNFVQDNISKSKLGTIRGLHYQVGEFAQAKLCEVIVGKVLDIAVDLRFGSPTFKEYVSVELSDENHYQFWIPAGFAHGFSVLTDEAIFHYKCGAFYSKKDERAILYNDPELAIDWQVTNPIISPKDLCAKPFKDIEKDFIYQKALYI